MAHAQDEQQIRDLIERWARAVQQQDLDGVVAGHAEDIVMFDVAPPEQGVRGLEEYRGAWPAFFAWIAEGARFELVDLDVTAGAGVAFAYAMLRCGEPEELAAAPGRRLRLSLGLVKKNGEWLIQHEHHSGMYLPDPHDGEQSVRDIHAQWFADTEAKNLDGIMSHIAEDVVSYEREEPIEYLGIDAVRSMCEFGLNQTTGVVTWSVPELRVLARDDVAVAWGLNRMTAQMADGSVHEEWSRGTRVFRFRDGAWTMVHQHVSYPR